jgi:acetate kinase
MKGQIDGIGTAPRFQVYAADGSMLADETLVPSTTCDLPAAINKAGAWLRDTQKLQPVAVGHRIVHGGPDLDRPIVVDSSVFTVLEQLIPLAPLHQSHNLAPIRSLLMNRPDTMQVACFDTAFHHGRGSLVDHYAIPEHLYVEGIRRYGFHGLSYEYVSRRLREVAPLLHRRR